MKKKGCVLMSENDVKEIKQELSEMRKEINHLSNQVAGLSRTVELLVEGKIRTNGNGESKAWSKVTLTSLEIIRLIVAGIVSAVTAIFATKG
jgi:hypothetical protein